MAFVGEDLEFVLEMVMVGWLAAASVLEELKLALVPLVLASQVFVVLVDLVSQAFVVLVSLALALEELTLVLVMVSAVEVPVLVAVVLTLESWVLAQAMGSSSAS